MHKTRSSISDSKGRYKKRKFKKFKKSWLDDEIFKGWLTLHTDGERAHCTACNEILVRTKSELTKHAERKIHLNNINRQKVQKVKNQPALLVATESIDCEEEVKEAINKLRIFFMEYDITPDLLNHMMNLLKELCTQSYVINDIVLSRTKCMQVVKNVISKRATENTVENLKQQKFSVLISRNTITNNNIFSILVKYIDQNSKKCSMELLELIKLNVKDCSVNEIYLAFKNCLEDKEIPLNNIVGIMCVNTFEVIESYNNFINKLKIDIPALISLKYISHSSAIVTNKAWSKLPESCEHVLHAISKYTSNNANVSVILQEYQQILNTESQKISKLSDTKWHNFLHKLVIKLLDNWEVLKQYFSSESSNKNNKSAQDIYQILNNDYTKAYMLFLRYSLYFLNNFYVLFQSKKILIHELFERSCQLIRQIGQNFLLPASLKNISLDIIHSQNFLPLNKLYVGPECEMFLQNKSCKFTKEVRLKCLDFYVSVIKEIMGLLPFNDVVFDGLKFLDPKFALSYEKRSMIRDPTDIATYFGIYDITDLAFEWRILPTMFSDTDKDVLATLDINIMWKNIFETKNFTGQPMFPNLQKLVYAALSLPHSSTEAERIFSIIMDIKRKRTRISLDNFSAICKCRSLIQIKTIDYCSFQVDARHLELHNSHNLYDLYDDLNEDSLE